MHTVRATLPDGIAHLPYTTCKESRCREFPSWPFVAILVVTLELIGLATDARVNQVVIVAVWFLLFQVLLCIFL